MGDEPRVALEQVAGKNREGSQADLTVAGRFAIPVDHHFLPYAPHVVGTAPCIRWYDIERLRRMLRCVGGSFRVN